jgi:MobA/VirD2-like, nuclease domain
MIQNLSPPGGGFGHAIAYALQPSKKALIVAGNVRGRNVAALVREFNQWRDLNPGVACPVFHACLSAAPADSLSSAGWREVAERYVREMHYGDSPWIAIQHADTDIDHIHVIASRIRNDGACVDSAREFQRGRQACRLIEREMGLTGVVPRGGKPGEFVEEKPGDVRDRLRALVSIAARGTPSISAFIARLEALEVEVKVYINEDQVVGIGFALGGVACKGCSLGRDFSWPGLQRRHGVRYEPARDLPALLAASARAKSFPAAAPPRDRLDSPG